MLTTSLELSPLSLQISQPVISQFKCHDLRIYNNICIRKDWRILKKIEKQENTPALNSKTSNWDQYL